jgi:hypothetical protein
MSNIKVLPLSVLTQNTLTLSVNEDIKSVHLNDTLLCNYTEEVYTDSVCHKELQKFFTAIKYSGEIEIKYAYGHGKTRTIYENGIYHTWTNVSKDGMLHFWSGCYRQN